MKNTQPLISIILPVYNAASYIEESIRSILNQTFGDFELIIIDDGSTDNSKGIIEAITDTRIRFYAQDNMGLAKTLNKGIELAQGDFIARQDADDISLPPRFEKQIQFLLKNPEINLLGTWAEVIPMENNIPRFHKHSTDDLQLKLDLLFDNPFVHTSVMIRKSCLTTVGAYAPEKVMEDYNLWSRIARNYQVANIPEVLVKYREVSSGLSKIDSKIYSQNVISQNIDNISYYHPEDSFIVAQLCKIYHKETNTVDDKVSLANLLNIMRDVAHKVAGSKGGTVKSYIQPHIQKMISRYYDLKKQEASKNGLLLFWLKVICRIRLILQS